MNRSICIALIAAAAAASACGGESNNASGTNNSSSTNSASQTNSAAGTNSASQTNSASGTNSSTGTNNNGTPNNNIGGEPGENELIWQGVINGEQVSGACTTEAEGDSPEFLAVLRAGEQVSLICPPNPFVQREHPNARLVLKEFSQMPAEFSLTDEDNFHTTGARRDLFSVLAQLPPASEQELATQLSSLADNLEDLSLVGTWDSGTREFKGTASATWAETSDPDDVAGSLEMTFFVIVP